MASPTQKMSLFSVLGIGAIYEDVILTVPHFPHEDSKLRATSRKIRLGGNVPNTLSVLSQILTKEKDGDANDERLFFMGALGAKESSVFVERELEKRHIKLCTRNRPESGAPTAYILESTAPHTRTIINYSEVTNLGVSEMIDISATGIFSPKRNIWVHAEGRNCDPLFEVLSREFNQEQPLERVSIDFERPGREGLEKLFPYADVAFISKNYASWIALRENAYSNQQITKDGIIRGFLKNFGKRLMNNGVGYITVGGDGCYVFTAKGSTYASALLSFQSGYWEGDWLFIHLPTKNDGPVVETTGAGDTFIAGVIYGLGVLKLDPVEAGKLGNIVAGKKCLQEGFDGVWKDVQLPPS